MQDSIQAFVDSLALPTSLARSLTSRLHGDSNLEAFLNGKNHDSSGLIPLVCLLVEACLGADSVDTIHENRTEVDANWFVIFFTQGIDTMN